MVAAPPAAGDADDQGQQQQRAQQRQDDGQHGEREGQPILGGADNRVEETATGAGDEGPLTACTPPATSRPQIMANRGWVSPMTPALAAKRRAPATGRTKVWMASLTVSAAGTLSTRNSMTSSTANTPITHQLSRASQGGLRVIREARRCRQAKGRKEIQHASHRCTNRIRCRPAPWCRGTRL